MRVDLFRAPTQLDETVELAGGAAQQGFSIVDERSLDLKRSNHRAYAYLITPPPTVMTPDAKKRLEAITSMEDLGAGFTLATHDLEIRGAEELLRRAIRPDPGDRLQPCMDLLERAVRAL